VNSERFWGEQKKEMYQPVTGAKSAVSAQHHLYIFFSPFHIVSSAGFSVYK
jgi:hypothetical protein